MPERDKQRNKRAFGLDGVIICLLAVALVVAVGLPVYNTLIMRTDARLVLSQSKTVELAAVTVAAQCRANGRAFADQSAEYGFAEGVVEEIKELSACEGEVYLLQWDEAAYMPQSMLYVEGEFAAFYNRAGGEGSWSVSHLEPVYPGK